MTKVVIVVLLFLSGLLTLAATLGNCKYVPHGVVNTSYDAGYWVMLPMEGHPLATDDVTEFVPWDDARIRISRDEFYHVCLSKADQAVSMLYVPGNADGD